MDSLQWEHARMYAHTPLCRLPYGKDFFIWKQQAREKFREILSMPEKTCADYFTIDYDIRREQYREIRFRFQSEPDFWVPCHLLLPYGDKRPLAVCLQGHAGGGMYLSLGIAKTDFDREMLQNRDGAIALRALREGYAALILEQRCLGEQGDIFGQPNCHITTMDALSMGRTMQGLRTWDVLCALDCMQRHFSSLYMEGHTLCFGNSAGGVTTLFAAALDDRICAAIVSCSLPTALPQPGKHQHCPCGIVPNLYKYLDYSDIAGLLAPRPFVIVAGDEDPMVNWKSCYASYTLLKERYYPASGAAGNVKFCLGHGGHRFYADLAFAALHSMLPEQAFEK